MPPLQEANRRSRRWPRDGCVLGGGPDPQFARWSLWMNEVFNFKQMVVWDNGPMGMGWHYRRSYETVLVGTKRAKDNSVLHRSPYAQARNPDEAVYLVAHEGARHCFRFLYGRRNYAACGEGSESSCHRHRDRGALLADTDWTGSARFREHGRAALQGQEAVRSRGGSESVADSNGERCRAHKRDIWPWQSDAGWRGSELANSLCKGLEIEQCEQGDDVEKCETFERNCDQRGWWSTEPDVGRVVDGVASRVDRLDAIGNGQVPAVAATAWRLLSGETG